MRKRICVALVAAALLALSGGGWKWKAGVQPAKGSDTTAVLVAPSGWSWGDAPDGWSWGGGESAEGVAVQLDADVAVDATLVAPSGWSWGDAPDGWSWGPGDE